MKRNILSAGSFLLILAVLLTLLSLAFFPKGNRLEDGIQEPELYGFLGEPENSLDVVVLGDSIPLCSMIPPRLWRDFGYTSYVCASTAQKLCQSEKLLTIFLKSQQPKFVLLETDQLYLEMSTLDVLQCNLEALLPVLRYHDNWKFVRPSQMLRTPDYSCRDSLKGYHLRKTIDALDPEAYMLPTEEAEPIFSAAEAGVRRIKALCDRAGAKLVLYTAPNAAAWNTPRHNAVQALADSLEVPYLDGNLEVTNLVWQSDTLDKGEHLNLLGAEKVTAWLGTCFASTGLLEDKRGDPAYALWEEDLAEFERRVDDPEHYY